MEKIKVHFLGAAGTVTGSKYLIETSEKNILIDCGMFQGAKDLRDLNWNVLPIDASTIDVVLLTHGHLDHTGYLPRLLKQGFKHKIIGTSPTMEIARIILLDSGKIHEEEARKANEEGYSSHQPALPFYTVKDALRTLQHFQNAPLDKWLEISENIRYRFKYNGHILGATFIELEIFGRLFVFSGDIGRVEDHLLRAPERPQKADYLFIESTYGNRLHSDKDEDDLLIDLVRKTIDQQGTLIIPSFAVERLQTLMYLFWRLKKSGLITNIPVFVDSPMGNNVLKVFENYPEWHKLSMDDYFDMKDITHIVESYKETWEVINNKEAKIVIAGSGMVTGGRVLTYLQQMVDHPETIILLAGFMAEGTRGRQLLEGAHELKLFGKYYPVKAEICHIESLSAHADQQGLLDWMSELKARPNEVFLVHGETTAADSLRVKIQDSFDWNVKIPQLYEILEIVVD